MPKLPTEAEWARIRRAAEATKRKGKWLDRKHRPKAPPGVICPFLRTPWYERFRCFVHPNAQGLADNDWVCRKLCLPRGGPFKQAMKPRGIATGGRAIPDLRGLGIPAWQRPSRPSPNQRPPGPDPSRRRVYGRKVA